MLVSEIVKIKKARKKPDDTASDENEQKPAKKAKKGEKSELNNLSAQNKKLWKLIDKLKTLEKKEVRKYYSTGLFKLVSLVLTSRFSMW